MHDRAFIELLEDVLESEPGTITMEDRLDDIEWDSLSSLALISALNSKFGLSINAKRLQESVTVRSLFEALGESKA